MKYVEKNITNTFHVEIIRWSYYQLEAKEGLKIEIIMSIHCRKSSYYILLNLNEIDGAYIVCFFILYLQLLYFRKLWRDLP